MRRVTEKEINSIGELFKIYSDRGKVTVDDHARLNLEDISIIVDEEWDKLFTKDVPEVFKTDACDAMCSLYFNKGGIPTYAEYIKLVDKYNKSKDDDNENKYYYYYLLATMMKTISCVYDY